MKYILYPFYMINMLLFFVFIFAPIRFIWNLVWHFNVLSFRDTFSINDAYLFDRSFKQFIKEVFIYNS